MRLIDADALVERTEILDDVFVVNWTTKKVQSLINAAPTIDAVPVVRCKDCEHNVANMETDPWDDTDYEDIVCLHWMSDGCGPNDFCSRGERRNDADLHLPG